MKRISRFILLCMTLMLFASPALAATYYVKTNGDDTNNAGTSWATAFKTIGQAVSKAAENDEIRVASGTYEEAFSLNKAVKLKGSYPAAGGDTQDYTKNTTTLQMASNVSYSQVIYCTANATIDGFTTINPGKASDGSKRNSIWIANAYPTIINCNFKTNTTDTSVYGSGIYIGITDSSSGTVTVKNCTFTGTAKTTAGPGGGVYCYIGGEDKKVGSSTAKLLVENCTFKENSANSGGGVGFESGSSGNPTLTVRNCLFDSNIATSPNGFGGGGVYCLVNWFQKTDSSNYQKVCLNGTVENCTFLNNNAHGGGGICVVGAQSDSQQVKSSFTVQNCTFNGNSVVNTTGGNTGPTGYGGAIVNWDANVSVINCTFFDNKITSTNGKGAEIANSNVNGAKSTTTVTNSIIANKTTGAINTPDSNANGCSLTLVNCAYNTAAATSAVVTTNAKVTNLDWSSRKSEKVKIGDIEHTVYKLTASDTALITGGTATGAPKTDQLGMARSTSTPSIGAVEGLSLGISNPVILPAGTVNKPYTTDLKAEYTPAQSGTLFKWDQVSSGDALSTIGLELSADKIIGTPKKVGTYNFTLSVVGSGDLFSEYSATKDFILNIASPDIGKVSIALKNAVGANTAAFSVTSKDVTLTASNDLIAGVVVAPNAYLVAEADSTPVFSVDIGNTKLLAAYVTDTESSWINSSDLQKLDITTLTAIKGVENPSETSPDYYRFQFSVSDDAYFILEMSVLLSGSVKSVPVEVVSGVISGSVTEDTVKSGDAYYVPANGSNNMVTKSGDVWVMPRKVDFTALQGGFTGFVRGMANIARSTRQITTGVHAPDNEGFFTKLGAALSTYLHPGVIVIVRLAPSGWRLPANMSGFEIGSLHAAKVENGAIVGAMITQNSANNTDENEEIKTLTIDTSNLRDPDNTNKKVPIPEGKYAVSYSTLLGEVSGAFSDDIKIAASNYTPPEEDDDDSSSSGGSGGCDTGLSGMTLLALAAIAIAGKVKK